jgi:hypothetical protein
MEEEVVEVVGAKGEHDPQRVAGARDDHVQPSSSPTSRRQ